MRILLHMEREKGPSDYFRETREARQEYEDARHALLFVLDDAHADRMILLPGHTPYSHLTRLDNEFRSSFARYRDALRDGSSEQTRLQADFSDIQTRAAQKLLDLSPYDLPPEE